MSSLVWFTLVDSEGQPFKDASPSKVHVPASSDVDDFRKAVKAEYANKLSSVDSGDLLVCENSAAFNESKYLEAYKPISGLGTSFEDALVVVVPGVRGNA